MSRVVVIGGGIAGAFAAWYLGLRKRPCTLVERDDVAAHASGTNPGGLNPLHGAGIPGPLLPLALESFRLHLEAWDRVRELAATAFTARRIARLHLAATEAERSALEPQVALHRSVPGFAARWLAPDELERTERRLGPDWIGGYLTEGNVKLDARAYTRAVVEAAVRLGATVVEGEARGLRSSGGRASEVVLDRGTISCDGVVVATGPWVGGPAEWLGIPLPVEPVRGELLVAALDGPPLASDLAWRDAAVYGGASGRVMLGGTEERTGLDARPSAAGRVSILERAARLVPDLAGRPVVEHVAALRPVTADGLPIVGLADGWENVALALGGGRKGMLFASAMGRAVADLVCDGRTAVPIDPCSPRRTSLAGGSRASR